MASDDKEKPEAPEWDTGSVPDTGQARPRHTIEGEAEEIETEDATETETESEASAESDAAAGDETVAEAEAAEDTDSDSDTAAGDETTAEATEETDPEADAAAGDETTAEAEAAEETGPDADAASAEDESAESKPPPKEPPQRTRPRDVRGFVTHLAAGLVGGLVGVVGAGIGLDKLPLGALKGGAQPAAESQAAQALDGRIAELEKKLAAAAENAAPGGAPAPEALAPLEGRLGEVEQKLQALGEREADAGPPLEETLAPLKERLAAAEEKLATGAAFADTAPGRLDRLEESLKTLGETAEQGGDVSQTAAIATQLNEQAEKLEARIKDIETRASDDAGAAATQLKELTEKLEARIGEVETRLGDEAGTAATQAVTALQQDLAALKKTIEEQPEPAPPPELPPDLTTRLPALEESVAKLVERAAEPPPAAAGADAAALAVAFAELRTRVAAGKPYADLLDKVTALAPDGLDLSALAPHAGKGVATLRSLEHAFPAHAKAAHAALQAPKGDDTLVSQLLANARSVVRVRRIGDDAAGPEADALGRVAASLKSGDLSGALSAAATLPEGAQQALKPWLDRARGRASADAALDKASLTLAGALTGDRPAPPQ